MAGIVRWLAAALLLAAAIHSAQAQPAQTTAQDARVVTRILPPMVIDQKGQLSGFSIDLWNRIAERLQLKTSYEIAPDVRALLEEVRAGRANVGISAVSITAAREREFDFSQPMLNAGLQIMIRGGSQGGESNALWDLLGLLFSQASLVWLGIATLLVLVPAHIVWLLERRHPNGIIPTPHYIPGIFHALY